MATRLETAAAELRTIGNSFVEWLKEEVPTAVSKGTEVQRFFIDRLSATGDIYLIPAEKRMDWHDFEIRCEETGEAWPLPEWAKPVDEMSHIEFEQPTRVM